MASLADTFNPQAPGYLLLVEKASGLRAADFGFSGKSDPYVVVTHPTSPSAVNEKTSVILDNLNPVWNECFLITTLPREQPPVLRCTVFDKDNGSSDVS